MTTTHPIMRKQLRTTAHTQMLDITETVAEAVRESGAANGIATVFVAHTLSLIHI